MAEPEWGKKRQCPKCSTRFYDLGKDDPITCINCGSQFAPEVILKSKQQPMQVAKVAVKVVDDEDDDDILDDDDDILDDDDVDIDVDDETLLDDDDDDTDVSVVVAPKSKSDNE